jgi:hypothetical protein
MKCRITVLAAALCLLSITPAGAATISFSLFSSLVTVQPGADATFGGTMANTGSTAAFLNGDTWTFPFAVDDTPFFVNFPPSLSPGASASGTLFTASIPTNAGLGLYVGVFSVLGGDNPAAQNVLGNADFGVNVVPEPGTVSLVAAGLLLAAGRVRARTRNRPRRT